MGEVGIQRLKAESDMVHKQLQPLWRRKAEGERLLTLDHPVAGGGTLVDLLADSPGAGDIPGVW